jgi:hypothetical protein
MKNLKTKTPFWLLFFVLLSGSTTKVFCQFPDTVVAVIKAGNAEELSKYFSGKIELVMPQKSGIFSKSQAQLILADFFKSYPVINFKIIHEGVRENSSFAIGRYRTQTQSIFRFHFLTKTKDDRLFIHQLRIEKQDD